MQLYKTEFEKLCDRVLPTIKGNSIPLVVLPNSFQKPVAPAVKVLSTNDLGMGIQKSLTEVLPGILEAASQKTISQMLFALSSAALTLKLASRKSLSKLFI